MKSIHLAGNIHCRALLVVNCPMSGFHVHLSCFHHLSAIMSASAKVPSLAFRRFRSIELCHRSIWSIRSILSIIGFFLFCIDFLMKRGFDFLKIWFGTRQTAFAYVCTFEQLNRNQLIHRQWNWFWHCIFYAPLSRINRKWTATISSLAMHLRVSWPGHPSVLIFFIYFW